MDRERFIADLQPLLMDTKDETAAQFYEHHGFRRLQDSPRSLDLPLVAQMRRSQTSHSKVEVGADHSYCERTMPRQNVSCRRGIHFISHLGATVVSF
jgi:hypothetical protein